MERGRGRVLSPTKRPDYARLLLQCGLDCSVVGKDAGFELGVNLCPVDNDLEPTVVIRDQGQALHLLFIMGQYVFRQTDGFRLIASRRAIFNPNIHTASSACDPYHSGKSYSTKRATRPDFAFLTGVVYAPAKNRKFPVLQEGEYELARSMW